MSKHYLYSGDLIITEPFLLGIPMDYVMKSFAERDYKVSVEEKKIVHYGSYQSFMEIYEQCVSEVKQYWDEKGLPENEFCLPQYYVPNYSYWAADKDSVNGKYISPAFLFYFEHDVMLWTVLPLVEAGSSFSRLRAELGCDDD